jgi:predicted ATPase
VHTGVVVVGLGGGGEPHERWWALGEAPTVAAQMQGLAAPNTVVISAATRRLIQGYFTCCALGAQTCQGVATPLQVYRVVEESGATSRLDAATARGLTPLVGREHEIGLLVECWGHATTGLGRVAVISGEVGIGKSRLVRVLQERLSAEPHTQIEWRCSPYDHQSPLHPVLTHLQRLVRMRPEDAPAEILRRLEEVLEPYGFAMAEVVPLFAALLALPLPEHYPPLMLTPQRQKSKTLEALLAWLRAETARQPVLFIIEDVQWLDPSTLEWLSLLIDQAPTARLLMVLTSRPEFHPPWGFHASLTPITLGRLSHAQATILLQRVAGKALPPEVQRHLVAKTDGVPLFVEELTKMVLESDLLEEREECYALTGPLPPLAIPATLHDSLMARLDRLATVKALAQLGATLGREFAYELLQAVSPWDEDTLQQGLHQLVEAGLLYQRGLPPQATYRFKHALIQDTAYQSLLRSTRQQHHQRIAHVVEERFPEICATQPELLARHYTAAGCAEQAVAYWQRAGHQASDRSAHLEAISHWRTGIELLTTLPATPEHTQRAVTLYIALGAALIITKGMAAPAVAQAFTQARALCQQGGEPSQLAPVLLGLWRFYLAQSQFHTVREIGDTLLHLARRTDDPALAVLAHYALGCPWLWLAALSVARRHLEDAIARYTPDQRRAPVFRIGHDLGVACRFYAAQTLWLLGYPVQALAYLHEALTLAHALSHPLSLAWVRCRAAIFLQFCRDVPAVLEQAEAAVALTTAQGATQWVAQGTVFRGWALAMQGQGEVGLAQVHQGITAVQATGAALYVPYLCTLLADISAHLGHTDDSLQALAEAHTLIEQHEDRCWEAEVCRLRGILLLRQTVPQPEEAETWLQRALDVARRQEAKSLELRAAMSLSRLCQQQGKRAEAYELLAPIYGWFTEGFDTADLQEAKGLLEVLA